MAQPTLAEVGALWEGSEWVDCTTEYNAQINDMEDWEHRIITGVSVEEIMSAPEIADPKTDLHHNWKQTKPLEILEKTAGALADVSKLSDEEVLDIMDALFTLENQLFINNNDPVSCVLFSVFAHKASLADGNLVLKAFLDAYYYDMLASLTRIGTSQVADEDEFPVLEQAVDVLTKRNADQDRLEIEDVRKALAEAKSQTKNESIIARLDHRLASLNLAVVLSSTDDERDSLTIPANTANVQALIRDVASAVDKLDRKKSEDAVPLHPKVFLQDCFSWLRISIPNKGVDPISFAKAKTIALGIQSQYKQVMSVFPLDDLIVSIYNFEAINASKFFLTARALLAVIISRQITAEDWKQLILRSFDSFGIPIFRKIYEKDPTSIQEVNTYRNAQQGANHNQSKEDRDLYTQLETILMRLAISVHDFLRVQAHHRALANRNIAQMFQRTWDILNEAAQFDFLFGVRLAREPVANNVPALKVQRCFYNWASVLYTFAWQYYVNTTVDLGLVTNAEFFGVLFLKNMGSRDVQESLAGLIFTQQQPIPKKHNKMGKIPAVNPTVTSRTQVKVAQKDTAANLIEVRCEVEKMLINTMFTVATLLEHYQIMDFSMPKESLVSASDVFNHRFGSVLGQTTRIPFFGLESAHNQKAQLHKDAMKAAEGKLGNNFAHSSKNLAQVSHALLTQVLTDADVENEALCHAFFIDAKAALAQNKTSLDLLSENWDDEAEAPAAAAALKEAFTVEFSFTKFALPVLTVKATPKKIAN